MKNWINAHEVHTRTGVSMSAINKYCRTGQVTAQKILDGKRYAWYVYAPDIPKVTRIYKENVARLAEYAEPDEPTGPAAVPCDYKPGSDEKVAMLAARVAAGQHLWHDDDADGGGLGTVHGCETDSQRPPQLATRAMNHQRGRRCKTLKQK